MTVHEVNDTRFVNEPNDTVTEFVHNQQRKENDYDEIFSINNYFRPNK